MTEKRFENRLDKSNVKFNILNPVWDNEKETGLNVFEMINLLNKYDIEYTMCHNDVLRLEKENEQLKEENNELRTSLSKLGGKYVGKGFSNKMTIAKLEKENEQLKKENNKWIVDYNGLNTEYECLKEKNEQLKEKNQKNIQFVFRTIETYSDDCFHHNEGGWSYMLNDLIENLKNGMEL